MPEFFSDKNAIRRREGRAARHGRATMGNDMHKAQE